MAILLLDFSNLAYLSFFNSLKVHKKKPEEVDASYNGHIDSFSAKIEKLLEKLSSEQTTPVFVLDQKPIHKYALYPEYKSNRKTLPFNPKPSLLGIIRYWGWRTIYSPDMEADDAIASFVARNFDDNKIVVVTSDKDIWQVNDHPNTSILNPVTLNFVTLDDLRESFSISNYSQIKLHKALWGDASDAVPNSAPRMQKYLLPVINKSNGELDDFYEKLKEERISNRCRELLDLNKAQIHINYELVRLQYSCKVINYQW